MRLGREIEPGHVAENNMWIIRYFRHSRNYDDVQWLKKGETFSSTDGFVSFELEGFNPPKLVQAGEFWQVRLSGGGSTICEVCCNHSGDLVLNDIFGEQCFGSAGDAEYIRQWKVLGE